jgi:hypothetical protein
MHTVLLNKITDEEDASLYHSLIFITAVYKRVQIYAVQLGKYAMFGVCGEKIYNVQCGIMPLDKS